MGRQHNQHASAHSWDRVTARQVFIVNKNLVYQQNGQIPLAYFECILIN